jgi:hypothetical protein
MFYNRESEVKFLEKIQYEELNAANNEKKHKE